MINIFGKIFNRGISLNLGLLNRKLRAEFTKIRHEFEEHLQSINENTNEIAANYEYICEIEQKLDNLSGRVDNIQMFLESNCNVNLAAIGSAKRNKFDVKRLNRTEQEVFLALYTLEEEKGSVTYTDIGERLGVSEQLAGNYVTALIEKGIPIIKRYIHSKPYLRLDPEFKTLQTKENILQLSLAEFGF